MNRIAKASVGFLIVATILVGAAQLSWGGQVWTKCHITCRCLQNNEVGAFDFVLPVDVTPDTGYEADLACKTHGYRNCGDCCNGTKFAYTYKVTSP